jgi:hypothetical protein
MDVFAVQVLFDCTEAASFSEMMIRFKLFKKKGPLHHKYSK